MGERADPRRKVRGEQHGLAKLTADDVRTIRARHRWHDRKHGVTAIARDYDLNKETVRAVIIRKSWAHVQ